MELSKNDSNAPQTGDTAEYIDDLTYIQEIKHSVIDPWHSYDILLAARGYGWEAMKDWADYMAGADLADVSQVTTSFFMGAKEDDVTESYIKNGRKCKLTPELGEERSDLSVAGISKTLIAPMKIVWFNQSRVLRFITPVNDELLITKYAETVIRRTFGTKDAMKLAKPLPENK